MTLTRKVAYNTITQVIGKILYLACSLAIVMLITRYLGVSGYGNYNTIIAYLGFFTVLADLGLWMIMVREISQHPHQKEKIVGNVLGLRIFSAIIGLVLANIIAYFLNYPPVVKIGILIFSSGIFFMLLNQVLLGVFQYHLRADKASAAEVLGRAFTLILVIYMINLGAGLLAIVAVSAAGLAINFLINVIFIRKYIKIIPKFEIFFWRKILFAALPIVIFGILTTIYYKIDTVLLSLLPLSRVVIPSLSDFSNSEAVGIYGAAYRVLDIVLTIPVLFSGLVYPIISQKITLETKKTQYVFQRSFDFLVVSGMFFSAFTFPLAPQIIDIIGGREFVLSASVLRILSLSFPLFFTAYITGMIITAAHKQKVLIFPFLIFALLNIIANIIFIPYCSFYAASWITTLGHFIVCIISYILVWKHTGLLPSLKIIPKVIFAGLIAGSTMFILQKFNLFFGWSKLREFSLYKEMAIVSLLILMVAVIYFGILYFLKVIKKEDLIALKSP